MLPPAEIRGLTGPPRPKIEYTDSEAGHRYRGYAPGLDLSSEEEQDDWVAGSVA
jgi:hypothetical protein